MTTEKEVFKRLLQLCQDCEIDNHSLHRVIASLRITNPEIPALEAFDAARKNEAIQKQIATRYRPLFDLIESEKWNELLKNLPTPRYLN